MRAVLRDQRLVIDDLMTSGLQDDLLDPLSELRPPSKVSMQHRAAQLNLGGEDEPGAWIWFPRPWLSKG